MYHAREPVLASCVGCSDWPEQITPTRALSPQIIASTVRTRRAVSPLSPMNRVQEIIDENKDQMPTALAKTLLDACKAEADAKPKLYRITVTRVTSVAYSGEVEGCLEACVKLQHLTQSLIVDLLDATTFRGMKGCALDLLNKGMLPESWLRQSIPRVINHGTDEMLIVHSIEPYVHKRAREE